MVKLKKEGGDKNGDEVETMCRQRVFMGGRLAVFVWSCAWAGRGGGGLSAQQGSLDQSP